MPSLATRARAQVPPQRSASSQINTDALRSGRPLDRATRAFMEPRFGHDFSRVRIHTDERAARSSGEMEARAYTVGRDIVFAAGEYAPGTAEGRRLLAHELAHAVQQRSSPSPVPHAKLRV